MKKILLFLIIIIIFTIDVNALDLNSKYAYVYNVKEDKIMFEKESKKEIPVASLTKIMTAIIVIENNSDLDKEVSVIDYDLRDMYEYAVAGFKVGQTVTIRDLLYGILLPSGSDAVNAAVRITSDSEEDFIKLMNKKVNELGLNNTYFSNPIGKDEGNYSSMYDISKILEYALDNNIFKEIFTGSEYSVNNLMLKGPLYRIGSDLVSGAKTGFTYDSMYSLASFSQKENFNYIVITSYANSYKDVVDDHINIYNYYFSNYGYHNYNLSFNIEIENGREESYKVNTDTTVYLENDYDKSLLTYKYVGKEKINKDIKKGDKLGVISIYYNDKLLKTKDIYLNKEIQYKNYVWILMPIILIFIFIIFMLTKNKKG